MPLLRLGYRAFAKRRSCFSGVWVRPVPRRWPGYAPLGLLPALVFLFGGGLPAWAFMWTLALAIGAGCKWLTWWLARRKAGQVRFARSLGYLLAWPGMDAAAFFDTKRNPEKPGKTAWLLVAVKILLGAAMVWGVTPFIVKRNPLAAAWVGAIGWCGLLHFGLFHLLALVWQSAGVDAKPIMDAPIFSRSLGEFWGRRWNAAFNALAVELVFRPVARRIGVRGATLAAFLASGLVHELVISAPAGGGYGWPTGYFLLQGLGVLFERSPAGIRVFPMEARTERGPRRSGVSAERRDSWKQTLAALWRDAATERVLRGWLFTVACTAGPAFWLFHPPFMKQVMLPFLKAIGAP